MRAKSFFFIDSYAQSPKHMANCGNAHSQGLEGKDSLNVSLLVHTKIYIVFSHLIWLAFIKVIPSKEKLSWEFVETLHGY